MSVPESVREKYKGVPDGTDKAAKKPSVSFVRGFPQEIQKQTFDLSLLGRLHAMALRWGYSHTELTETLAGATADPAAWLKWVSWDETWTGGGAALFCWNAAGLGDNCNAGGRPDAASEINGHRRDTVVRMLAQHPGTTRAFIVDSLPNGDGLVTLGVRGAGTCSLVIPSGRFDPFAIIGLFDQLGRDGRALVNADS